MNKMWDIRDLLFLNILDQKDKKAAWIQSMDDVKSCQNAGEKYDYVFLYRFLTSDVSDIKKVLCLLSDMLLPDGLIVILADNLLSADYMAGAFNKNTKSYFDGYNYNDNKRPSLLTKTQWISALKDSGLDNYKFFYPYPNLEYTKEIFTDGTFEKYQYGKVSYNFDKDNLYLFDENALKSLLVAEHVGEEFANSFMILAAKDSEPDSKGICYAKYNWDRDEKFRIVTTIYDNHTVEKMAVDETAYQHIENLHNHEQLLLHKDMRVLAGDFLQNRIVYPMLCADTLNSELKRYVDEKDESGFLNAFQSFYTKLFQDSECTSDYHGEEFTTVFGPENIEKSYHCICPCNIDLICDNVFEVDGTYQIIDAEWIFDFSIPVEFVVWRAVNELYSKFVGLREVVSRTKVLALFQIDEEDEKVFAKWGEYFAYQYVGSDSLRNISVKKQYLNIQKLHDDYVSNEKISEIFYVKNEDGFYNSNILSASIQEKQDYFVLDMDVPKERIGSLLLWKPFAGKEYRLNLFASDGVEIVGHNAERQNNWIYDFCMEDAFFYFKVVDSHIHFELKAEELSAQQRRLIQYQNETSKIDLLKDRIKELEKEKEVLSLEKDILQRDYDCIRNSTIWTKTEFIRNLKDKRKKEADKESSEQEVAVPEWKPVHESIRFHIDEAKVSQGSVWIYGWVLCENRLIEQAKLEFQNEYHQSHLFEIELKDRNDVKQAFCVPDSAKCGINVRGVYQCYTGQNLFLQLKIEGEWYRIDTDTVIEPSEEARVGEQRVALDDRAIKKLNYPHFCATSLVAEPIEQPLGMVDIIIPVYNGMQYLPTLFETMQKTQMDYRMILVDDCSPDESVLPYLERFAKENHNVVVLHNEKNLGFVKSVNRALQMAEHHVALVNTDVQLPKNWLERLMKPIFENEKVASTTPFTNSGTIFSFPDFCRDNALFLNKSVDEIDAVFRRIRPKNEIVPTGMGFCMGMNIDTLQKIGLLDDVTFELGYGEENDWCQRAIEAGYINVYVENLFVHHNHGGSFPSETKQKLLKQNAERLVKKHPLYNQDIAQFCEKDPNRDIREYVKFELLFHHDANCILAFNHDLGGGADMYLQRKKTEILKQGMLFVEVRYSRENKKYYLVLDMADNQSTCAFDGMPDVIGLLQQRLYDQIWINELATYPDLLQWLREIEKLKKDNATTLRLLVHDYFMICPSLTLFNQDAGYCGIPEGLDTCNECLLSNEYCYSDATKDMGVWRESWKHFMQACDEIIVFSKDSIRLLERAFGKGPEYQLIPHEVQPLRKVNRVHASANQPVIIGILGAISEQKGIGVLKEMLKYIEKNDIDMQIVVVGETAEPINSEALIVTGRYQRDRIPDLAEEYAIECFFIPSVWPETFSYTTSEIILMDMPIAIFDIGAPVERVSVYDKGIILGPPNMPVNELISKLSEFVKRNR